MNLRVATTGPGWDDPQFYGWVVQVQEKETGTWNDTGISGDSNLDLILELVALYNKHQEPTR
jgi:hypothetical protein